MQRFIGTNWRNTFTVRLIQVAARESPESPLQLNKTWFCGSLFKKPKPCLSQWHAHRNFSFFKDWFSATCWSCSNLTEKAAIFDRAILAGRSRRVSLGDVTAHVRVQGLGCIIRWAQEAGGGDTGGTSEGFYGKIAIKLVAKNSIFLFMCRSRSLMKDLYVYGDQWKALKNYYKQQFSRNASEFSSYFYRLVYKSGLGL